MTRVSDMINIIPQFETARILVIGDICLDRYVRGDVNRISSEAPIPIMVARQDHHVLGQAGNSFSNLAGLGGAASILSVVGDDTEGQLIHHLIDAEPRANNYLITRADRPTTVKTRYMSAHQQVFRVDSEPQKTMPEDILENLIAKAIELIPQHQIVILSDYGYGLLDTQLIRAVIDTATHHGVRVLVDPRGSDLSKYRGAYLVTPNRKELAEATNGHAVDTDADIIDAATLLMTQSGIQNVLATRSQDGMSIVSASSPAIHLRTTAREVYDVSGAGDTVIATTAAALSTGATLEMAATIANIAAGIVVGKVGTAPIRSKELCAVLGSPQFDVAGVNDDKSTKIYNWDDAREQIERWRACGLRVGFTNGCFDILHAGHVNYLNDARSKCDRLVLGLNYDQSIRLLKGPTRPVNDQESRATVIAGLGCVDMVTFFGATTAGEDNTAGKLIAHLKPDVYFKGSDYTIETLPEAKIMASFGGKVELIDLTEGLSTTKTIEKMKNASSTAA